MNDIQYFKNSFNTIKQISKDRGFTHVNEYELIKDSDLKYLINEKKLELIAKKNNNKDIFYAKFLLFCKVKPSTIKEIVNEINDIFKDKNINHLEIILIIQFKPNNSIRKLEKEYNDFDLQIMWCKQLQFNITKHMLVPNHIKLDEDEENFIIQKYNLKSKFQLPLILKNDPISRYYNYQSGDIIKIIKDYNNTNFTTSYRCVR